MPELYARWLAAIPRVAAHRSNEPVAYEMDAIWSYSLSASCLFHRLETSLHLTFDT